MLHIGAHVSAAGGVQNAPLNAQKIGASAFGMFTRSPRGWSAPPLEGESIALFKANLAATGIAPAMVLVHDNYLVNLASPKEDILAKSYASLLDEAQRVEQLGLKLLNFHPGSRQESELDGALSQIATYVQRIIDETNDVCMVIEMTAGSGAHTGAAFEEIATMLKRIDREARMGVCIDTCHIFAAGYDLRSAESYAATMEQFERLIGYEFLRGMHLNDSMKGLGSRVDRHSPLGEGEIGLSAFKAIAKHEAMNNIPLILETPEPARWATEISQMQQWHKGMA